MSDTATVEVEATADETAEVKTKPAKKVKALKPCASSLYSYTDAEGVTHTCGTEGRETTATFCPGHDAKLKSLLIKAGAAGYEVRKDVEGGFLTMSAMEAANEYGFASTVETGIAKAAEKAQAKAEREAKRAAAKAEREEKAAKAKAEREAKKAEREAAKAAKAQKADEDEASDADADA